MNKPRAASILVISFVAAALLAVIGHSFLSEGEAKFGAQSYEKLENLAKDRFVNGRGLSPCDGDAWETLRAARGRLISIGDSNVEMVAVVAPTFSDVKVVAFGQNYIRAYRFPWESEAPSHLAGWFSPEPKKLSDISLSTAEQLAITTPVARHIRYAMTAREYGFDGVGYYFGIGENSCAFAWMPRGPGPGGLIASIIEEVSGDEPSMHRILLLAKAIDDADGAR
ncbi:hypothetical protein [Pseudoxanthomonas jiangsuensis]|uniref:hypothetical protein n=1 Tax=Pseudoxanthomonas jiangsuensis TaxID=619688 RepID=UPI001391597A|nr:hypothetical protein [Pseudoxanthomonas jiangsuensis]